MVQQLEEPCNCPIINEHEVLKDTHKLCGGEILNKKLIIKEKRKRNGSS